MMRKLSESTPRAQPLRRAAVIIGLAMLSGCALAPSAKQAAERLEIDVAPAASPAALPIAEISLSAPSWLDTPQMGYRLRYSRAAKRDNYTLTRWHAPPSEMVLRALRRGVPQGAEGAGCRLRIELDEFVQDFTSAEESRARIEARVKLVGARGEAGPTRRFEVVMPATFADAAGGAQALNLATAKWIEELRAWLAAQSQVTRGLCKG